MLRHGAEGGRVGTRFGEAELAFQRAVYHKVTVAANRAGKVGVVGLREAIVAEGLGEIAGAIEALQQRDAYGGRIGFAAQTGEEFLKFAALGEVAGADSLPFPRPRLLLHLVREQLLHLLGFGN